MIYDEETKENEKGHNPKVSNQSIDATKNHTWLIVLLSIITLGLFGIYFIISKNELNTQQIKVNECASSIDVQLAKRRDTLIKLLDTTKSMCNYEASLLKDITKLRSWKIDGENRTQIGEKTDSALSRLIAVSENYPDIKASESFQKLMNAADYSEREFAAARRTYNSAVARFNNSLVSWPSSYIAAKNNMHTIKMFEASKEQKEDVDLAF